MSLLSFESCKEDRTTVVFGKVVDQNQQPVDSIMVIATGSWEFHSERVKHTFTDKNGEYILTIDVPRKHHALNTLIPYLPQENPKFQSLYKIGKIVKNGIRTNNCCIVGIGEKTQWDFELAPK
jgi:hypothetical protein